MNCPAMNMLATKDGEEIVSSLSLIDLLCLVCNLNVCLSGGLIHAQWS